MEHEDQSDTAGYIDGYSYFYICFWSQLVGPLQVVIHKQRHVVLFVFMLLNASFENLKI